MPHRKLVVVVPLLAALWGCVGVAKHQSLPTGWESLQEPPTSFAALYRLECCARRNLLLTLRGDGSKLDVSVTVQPGATLLRAFIEPAGGWLYDGDAECVAQLPEDGLPLGDGRILPLRPGMASVLMSGGVPLGSRPVAAGSAWVSAPTSDGVWSNRIEGLPPRVTEARLTDLRGEQVLDVRVSEHRLQRVPAVLELRAAGERFVLKLASWRGAGRVEEPAWLALTRCGGGE